jgi:AcrR family transcriptional regulator
MTEVRSPGVRGSTASRILEAASPVLAADPAATIVAIADAAGLSRVTVHRYFRTRRDLLAALDLEPDPGARERVLAAAAEFLEDVGLAGLSMDEVAARAGVSRATVYRLFPGMPALFRALLTAYAPLERITSLIEGNTDQLPEDLIPAGYRLAASAATASPGVFRAMIAEVASGSPDAIEGAVQPFQDLFRALGGYLEHQMAAGRIAPMDTTLAAQALLAPLLYHLLMRPLAMRVTGRDIPLADAAEELAAAAVRALQPPAHGAGTSREE